MWPHLGNTAGVDRGCKTDNWFPQLHEEFIISLAFHVPVSNNGLCAYAAVNCSLVLSGLQGPSGCFCPLSERDCSLGFCCSSTWRLLFGVLLFEWAAREYSVDLHTAEGQDAFRRMLLCPLDATGFVTYQRAYGCPVFFQWCVSYFHCNILLFAEDLNHHGTYVLAYGILCPPNASLEDSTRASYGLPPLDPTIDCTQPICLLWGTVNPPSLGSVAPSSLWSWP